MPAAAQDAWRPDLDGRMAVFKDARQIERDSFGNLYVVDRGARRLIRLSSDGLARVEIGGSGTDLPDPAAVEPTNGMLILAVDRSSGRILRYNRDLVPLGFIDVTHRAQSYSQRDVQRDERVSRQDGNVQPVDLVAGREGELFILDEAARNVLKLDALYNIERRIGTFGSGRGSLADPISLALTSDGSQLLVADSAPQGVFVFDINGAFVRHIAVPAGSTIVSIRDTPQGLVIVRSDVIDVLYDGSWTRLHPPESIDELVDVLFLEEDVLLLTRRALYHRSMPFAAE